MLTPRKVVGVLTRCRSSSMSSMGLQPPRNTPSTVTISRYNNNKLGAVYSSLYRFWTSRQAAANPTGQNAAVARRDAYSVILFDDLAATIISNDFSLSPDNLLSSIASHRASGGTDYTAALTAAQSLMVQHWSNERYVIPVGQSLRTPIDGPKVSRSHFPLRWWVFGVGCHCSFGVSCCH